MADQSSVNTRQNRDRSYPPGYGVVEPVANYRPWDIDQEFQWIYSRIREHTMVDIYRLWVLWTLALRAAHGSMLEIGSWRGGSGAVLAAAAAYGAGARTAGAGEAGSGPRRLFLADTFSGVVKAGHRDPYYKGGEHANTSAGHVHSLLDSLGLGWVELLAGVFPEDTGDEIADHRFALCHIDVDVYQSARDAFEWIWPRLVPGGVVVFDDYGFYGCEGVTACVEEVMDERPDAVVVPNLTGQAVLIRSDAPRLESAFRR